MIWLIIGLMTVITFYNRYTLMSPRIKFAIGPKVESFLRYTAPAVLTALWVPIVFVREQQLNIDLANPYFTAGILTLVLSIFVRQPLIIVIVGLALFTGLSRIG